MWQTTPLCSKCGKPPFISRYGKPPFNRKCGKPPFDKECGKPPMHLVPPTSTHTLVKNSIKSPTYYPVLKQGRVWSVAPVDYLWLNKTGFGWIRTDISVEKRPCKWSRCGNQLLDARIVENHLSIRNMENHLCWTDVENHPCKLSPPPIRTHLSKFQSNHHHTFLY